MPLALQRHRRSVRQGYGVGQDKGKASTTIRKPLPPATPTLVCTSAKCYEQGKDVKADPLSRRLVQENVLGSAECAAALKRLNDQKHRKISRMRKGFSESETF